MLSAHLPPAPFQIEWLWHPLDPSESVTTLPSLPHSLPSPLLVALTVGCTGYARVGVRCMQAAMRLGGALQRLLVRIVVGTQATLGLWKERERRVDEVENVIWHMAHGTWCIVLFLCTHLLVHLVNVLKVVVARLL